MIHEGSSALLSALETPLEKASEPLGFRPLSYLPLSCSYLLISQRHLRRGAEEELLGRKRTISLLDMRACSQDHVLMLYEDSKQIPLLSH
jgi:hypothetical protein